MFDLLLQNVAQHIPLDAEEAHFFTSLPKIKHLKKKEFLLRAGEVCRFETFVLEGCLRNYYLDRKGDEHILQFSVESWWTSDLYSLLTQTPATQFIDALEDSTLAVFEKDDLERLYQRVPKFERFFRIMLQNAFVAHQQRILQNIGSTGEERYLAFREKHPTLEQRLPQHQIAAYLGITPEFLSKIRGKLAKA
ncbi:MAG: Crp/Fnr family transcriptional regulator [Saprospiraceae bacterium]|nr:Crp/Fnr family transcriptional regulator [Saprospiraceae bacterium]